MTDIPATDETLFALWRAVEQHPDYAFGTIFVAEDFPHGQVPDDFSANHATDRLAEAGNEHIMWEVGECEEDEEPWESESQPDIFDLFQRVREHPDFVFGTIFVPGDFPGNTIPEGFSAKWGKDRLAEAGNEYILLTCGATASDLEDEEAE